MSDWYKKQLKNPKWLRFAENMKELRKWKCEECGNVEKILHTHHKKYLKNRKPWQYNESLIQVLCEDCHRKEHLKRKDNESREDFFKRIVKFHFCSICAEYFIRHKYICFDCDECLGEDQFFLKLFLQDELEEQNAD